MKAILLTLALLAGTLSAQMEKRVRVLYDREAFRKRTPIPGAMLPGLTLQDLKGRKVNLLKLASKKRLIIIGGAWT